MKLTWTILIVCLSFLTFALPVTILNVYDPDSQHVGPNMQVPICYLYLFAYNKNLNEKEKKAF